MRDPAYRSFCRLIAFDVLSKVCYSPCIHIIYNSIAEAVLEQERQIKQKVGIGMRRYRGRYRGRRTKHLKIIAGMFALLIAVLSAACVVYVQDFYRADETALEAMVSDRQVTVNRFERSVVFLPEEPACGVIFYPGGKVEHTAYAPLMRKLAENGVLCVVPEMPGNLAVLNHKAASGIPEQYPEIAEWYLAGHSLGGSMAAVFAADHAENYEGLILLAAYSTADLRESGLRVLSIYGSEDGVLDFERYNNNRSNLPDATREILLDGGNHACFGSYGLQTGDGASLISQEKQMEETAEEILAFLSNRTN